MLIRLCSLVAVAALAVPAFAADSISGTYLESRSCQVYTGPCFANAETGMAGKEAVMAWNIEAGKRGTVDLKGLSVVVVLRGDDMFGHGGLAEPKEIKSAIIVDDRATAEQRDALISFAKEHTGKAAKGIVRIDAAPIRMSLDTAQLKGELKAGDVVKVSTRKVKPGDCICSNEIAFYPPLTQMERFAPGVATESEYSGRGLGATWSNPESRSAYMGEFVYE
jgi:Uncharacterized conserved protein